MKLAERFWAKVEKLPGEDACWKGMKELAVAYGVDPKHIWRIVNRKRWST